MQKASTYQQLDAQLKGEVAADQAQITELQNVVRVTLANGILFPEGGWELNPAGKATLAKLAPVLKALTGYQSSTCEQRAPKSEQEQRLISRLDNDPQLRTAFLNKVAGPISNKMFECGMIP